MAAAYSPNPYAVWVARFRSRVARGLGVLDPANPAPMAGCMTNHGPAIVMSPTMRAGHGVGDRAQSSPQIASSGMANAIPMA